MILWKLFVSFARVGVLTFGGGYAMIPILEREIVEKQKWASSEELMDYYAVGQCTPGIIAVNTATFIGRKYRGTVGGIVTTLGVVSPSVIIISLIAALINGFSDIAWVRSALAGIRVCVCVFILNAVIKLLKSAVVDKATLAMYAAIFLAAVFFDVPLWVFIVVSGVLGNLLSRWGVRGK